MKMKRWLTVVIGFLLVMVTIPNYNAQENKNKLSFVLNFERPALLEEKIHNQIFTKVKMDGISNSGNPGTPYLPVKPLYILLPYKTQVKEIRVTPSEEKFVDRGDVMPSPYPYPYGSEPLPPKKNGTIYNSSTPYPYKPYDEVGVYHFRGFDILILKIYPVKYIPIRKEIYYYPSIKIDIKTEPSENANPLYRGFEKDIEEVVKKVDNPEEVQSYPVYRDRTTYEMVIITTDAYTNSGTNTFQYLKNFKNSHGIPTTIVTVEDIESDPNYWNTSSQLFNDTQAQIRNFIRYAYLNWGTDYVLLGGDADDSGDSIVPARDLYVTAYSYVTYMPSDLYYACLDGNYNSDMDNKWGEPTDGPNGGDVDLFAEVYVGRACIDSQDEMENFVAKTISYSQTTDDYIWNVWLLGEYLGFGGVADWGGNYKDEFVDYSDAHGYFTFGFPSELYTINKLYDRDYPGHDWPASELISEINSNEVHLINHLGHANEYYNMKLYTSDVDSLTNTNYFFAYSQGCDAGAFDYDDCIAEHFTVSEHAAFAGVWNARYGWGASYSTDGPSQRYDREFWDAVYGEAIYDIGRANQDSKEDNAYRINEVCMRWCYYETNLFGDPSVKIRGLEGGPHLSYDPHYHNFGVVDEGEIYTTTFDIWNSGNGTLYWNLQENIPWLTCSPTSGDSTGEHDTVTVTIDTTGLSGTNSGYIFISSNGGSGAFQVLFYIPSGPILSYNPASYDFGAVNEGEIYNTTFEISNAGDGVLNWQLSDEFDWLWYSPSSGSVTPVEPPDVVTVYINTTGMSSGIYSGGVNITSNGGNGTFTVTFFISGPILAYSPDLIDFGDVMEGETANAQFQIWNDGIGTLVYNITCYADWVEISPTSGTSTGEHDYINVHINTMNLTSGYHSTNIYVTSNGGGCSIPVIVNVIPSEIYYWMNLSEGWNSITIPLENARYGNQTISNASDLFDIIPGCNIILGWNSSSQDFEPYIPNSPHDFPIEVGRGLFVSVDFPSNLQLAGQQVDQVNIPLNPGWNMLGWFKDEPTTARSIYENITSCNTVLTWNVTTKNFNVYIPGSPYNSIIKQGYGFLVGVSNESIWHGEG